VQSRTAQTCSACDGHAHTRALPLPRARSRQIGAVLVITFAAWLGMLASWVYAPAPFLPFIPKALWQLLVGVAGMTTAQNLTLPAIQPLLVLVCERRNLGRDEMSSIVSSTNLMAFGCAGALAPLISGGLFQNDFIPVEWIVTGWCLSFGILGVLISFLLWDLQLILTRGPPPAATSTTGSGGEGAPAS
jgi:MFS family permease